jgi:oligogalacturonide lyase
MPYYCNHYHANNDNTLLVGDQTDHLVLIDVKDEKKPKIETLCSHGTSWVKQRTHCHPTFSWSCDQILYTSDKDGTCNIYIIRPDRKKKEEPFMFKENYARRKGF